MKVPQYSTVNPEPRLFRQSQVRVLPKPEPKMQRRGARSMSTSARLIALTLRKQNRQTIRIAPPADGDTVSQLPSLYSDGHSNSDKSPGTTSEKNRSSDR